MKENVDKLIEMAEVLETQAEALRALAAEYGEGSSPIEESAEEEKAPQAASMSMDKGGKKAAIIAVLRKKGM